MSATWGADSLPVELADNVTPDGDKALLVLGEFLQAAINSDLGALWASLAPSSKPVEHVFACDPKHKFSDTKLPALYLYEESSTIDVLCADYVTDTRVIVLQWVSRMSSAAHEVLRERARHLIGKSIGRALRQGRHRDWVHPGDADEGTSERGSLVCKAAGLTSVKRLQSGSLELSVSIADETTKPIPFRGWATKLQVVEVLVIDPTDGTRPSSEQGALEVQGQAV